MNDDTKPQEDTTVAGELKGAPEELLDKVDSQITHLESELEAARQDVLYAKAETQNVRRRLEKDIADARTYAATGFARDILSVSDNLARALDAIPAELREDEKFNSFVAGIEATARELDKIFAAHGISRIAAMGLPLDPNQHQAMLEVPSADAEPGTVLQELQAGYMIKDRLLRPSMVAVAKSLIETLSNQSNFCDRYVVKIALEDSVEVSGKVVLVTGGGGGIGAGIAEAFAEKGAKVAVTDINLDYARAEAERIDRGTFALSHDVTSLESWAEAKQAVEARFGPIDVLCNNAGIAQPFKPLEDMSPDAFARLMAINVTGVFNGCKTFIPDMKARGAGHIVNTSSVNGMLPFGSFAAYSASKFAVAGLSEAIREELAPFGVGVSILYPGLTRSRMSEGQVPGLSEEAAKALAARMMDPIWLGRAVVQAVEKNELHIITHPDHRGALEMRINALYGAFREPAEPGYTGGSIAVD